jgi:ATP-binding cassette, subfamily B, multidrug efflux pump
MMKTILRYLKPYSFSITIIFILVATRAVLDLLLPLLLGLLLNAGLGLSNGGVSNMSKIFEYSLWMLLASVLSIAITIFSGYMESSVSSKFAKHLRRDYYKKVQSFSLEEIDAFGIGSLITRSTNDIKQLQMNVNTLLRLIILQPVFAIGAIVFSVLQQPTLSMVLIASISALIFIIVAVFKVVLPKFELVQKLVDKLNQVIRENLSGLRVIRAFNTQKTQEAKIIKAAKESRDLNVFVNRLISVMFPVMSIIMGLTSVVIIYLGNEYFIGIDGFDPGQLVALQQYSMRAIMAFMFLSFTFIMIPRALISARRVAEVLNTELSIKDPENPVETKEFIGNIEFKNVTFKYSDAPQAILENISFKIKAGQTVAFIGSTGSGKSTLVNLIPRFYDVTEGEILIDGINIKDMTQETLHEIIGYVPQQGILFSGQVKYNVLFGKKAYSEEELEEALEIAQAKSFVDAFEGKTEYKISQGGKNVSGGQRQRLSIARAIAKKPAIFIFDDSFSALDYQTDKALRAALNKRIGGTKLIVAQRINSIRHADVIVVLEKGQIAGIGTHDDLLISSVVYQEIANSQLSKEELSR